MALPLAPKSLLRCDEKSAQQVHDALTAIIAGHPGATTTYLFYEEIDKWLGPWGESGYPLGYGKFYNVAFTTNADLMADAAAREWVWKTTILLQEAIRDFVVARVRSKTIWHLSEEELRDAAFNSHPTAYTAAGLARLVILAPALLPVIATIPGKEFDPTSDNFGATIKQVLETTVMVAPQVMGTLAAGSVGPAHGGTLVIAARRDQQRLLSDVAVSRELGERLTQIQQGKLDHIPALQTLITSYNRREFSDQGQARQAREVVDAAAARVKLLQTQMSELLKRSPSVDQRVRAKFPNSVKTETTKSQ